MRILVHDFSGHPFQVSLSRTLASRGHDVLHVHCSSFPTGKGNLEPSARLSVEGIAVGRSFIRYSLAKRVVHEVSYGLKFIRTCHRFRPDVLISCNDPLISKSISAIWCRLVGLPWVYWIQDLYSVAIASQLRGRRLPFNYQIGSLFTALEARLIRSADSVVVITPDFLPIIRQWDVDTSEFLVQENWAPIEELPACPQGNAWRRQLRLPAGATLFLYSGTLGLKHNPDLLHELAASLGAHNAHVAVLSEGRGMLRLQELQNENRLPNLHLLPFQPYDQLPLALAASDVLVLLLEPDAGRFSVPSKLLTYLCAERAVVAAVPPENLAARKLSSIEAGLVASPWDRHQFLASARRLLIDAELRERMGRRARAYAERAFDGASIAARFEHILQDALASSLVHPKRGRRAKKSSIGPAVRRGHGAPSHYPRSELDQDPTRPGVALHETGTRHRSRGLHRRASGGSTS